MEPPDNEVLSCFAESGRRSVRARKLSQRVGQVSAAERENVRIARLDALENDDAAGEGVVGDSDEEFAIQESDEGAMYTVHGCRGISVVLFPA